MMYDSGLILEGGGMRGVFTAGVLDFFLEKILIFQTVTGFRQVHATVAVIFQNSREEHLG